MTLEELQNEMILALKNHDMEAKTTISGLIAQIKKAAIDVYIKGDIPETLVNSELLKAKKQAEESIAGAIAANRSGAAIASIHVPVPPMERPVR